MEILNRYAHLIVHYCLYLKEGETLYISSTTAAEPLIKEVYKEATKAGAMVEVGMSFEEQNKVFLDLASEEQLNYESPILKHIMNNFDAYLVIRAPYNLRENNNINLAKSKMRSKANAGINEAYFRRTANGEMKRSLCQFPTRASAQEAGMSLTEYQHFVYNACKLYDEDPIDSWQKVRAFQQGIVDHLNGVSHLRYKNSKTDISFSVKGRTWINSDGKTNMPSGEVFTGPVENSVNGVVYFDYPSIYRGQEVKNITLEVKDGKVEKWSADVGQDLLDSIMQIEGARYFGEVAIGTNYDIQMPTKNILFDEKIGGTIHMAIGQSYIQTGGKNKSSIHWDMIADMSKDGEIFADGELIYSKGKFLI